MKGKINTGDTDGKQEGIAVLNQENGAIYDIIDYTTPLKDLRNIIKVRVQEKPD